jgi:hypothetical protein
VLGIAVVITGPCARILLRPLPIHRLHTGGMFNMADSLGYEAFKKSLCVLVQLMYLFVIKH